MTEVLLEVNQLKKYFPVTGGLFGRKQGDVKAVDDISFFVNKGKRLDWSVNQDAANQPQAEC